MTRTTDPTPTDASHLAPGRFVERPLPSRWRSDPKWSERTAAPLRLLAGSGARPGEAELERLRRGLLERDDLGDALVRAMREEGTVDMDQFRTALGRGLEAVPDAPPALRRFFEQVEARPDWVDDALLDQGARACRRMGWDGWDILAYGSLLGGYRTAAALEPLVLSGRLSSAATLQRIGETGDWWLACTAPGGMRREAAGFQLSVHVRLMHAFVNYQLERRPDWDWDLRGVPINAYDQASTLGTFSTSYLLHARALGIRVSGADSRAVMHLWSYVGWLIGVPEEWLPRTEKVGRTVLYRMLSNDPGPDDNGRRLGAALLRVHEHYPGLSGWRRTYERERSLSAATFLASHNGMRELGLPSRPPWYPAYRIVSNVFWTHLVGRVPGTGRILDRRAARALERRMRMQYGEQRPPVGAVDPAH